MSTFKNLGYVVGLDLDGSPLYLPSSHVNFEEVQRVYFRILRKGISSSRCYVLAEMVVRNRMKK